MFYVVIIFPLMLPSLLHVIQCGQRCHIPYLHAKLMYGHRRETYNLDNTELQENGGEGKTRRGDGPKGREGPRSGEGQRY